MKFEWKHLFGTLALAVSLIVFAGCGGTQSSDKAAEDYPDKPITMIVTHGAGGDTDYNARLLARLMEKELG